ncbi:MAG: cell wall-active antibiotics response protein [Ignavibacteria bacterium]|nr:cell wall-active antibiotics response protein [Ignavibacteria bacterium]MBI3765477.1 cell wall-active antibiotics response protein [Ignavibacteriales bacterium]
MRNLIWGFVLIMIGVLLLLDNMGYADFGEIMETFWPLLLVIWGLTVLMRKRTSQRVPAQALSPLAPSAPPSPPPEQSTSPSIGDDLVHQSNVFGDMHYRITSQNFKGGSLSTVFGDCHLDLSSAQFAEGAHELRLHSVFGDSTIILPKDAAVSVSGSSLFGDLTILGQHKEGFSTGIKAETPAFESTTSRMKIIISKVFGDVRVV